MIRLSQRTLSRSLDALLEIRGADGVDALRQQLPVTLRALIDCDRTSVDEIDLDHRSQLVVPTPVPHYWARLGQVWTAHWHEHPIWRGERVGRLAPAVLFSDQRRDPRWRRSALRHDYYDSIGVRDQMAAFVYQRQHRHVGIAFSRASGNFDAYERAWFDLLAPHIACAWRNARLLSASVAPRTQPPSDSRSPEPHLVRVAHANHVIQEPAATAHAILRRFFPHRRRSRTFLPDELRRWLRVQVERWQTSDALQAPSPPYRVRCASSVLTVRVLRLTPIVATLQFAVTSSKSPPTRLTSREHEILTWLDEGKRNAEIAVILGISARTVEKHVEHILSKLDAENRTVAVLCQRETR